MTNRATEKIIEALSQLLEGFAELQDSIESEYSEETEDDDTEEAEEASDAERLDPDAAIVSQMKTAIEAAIETDDYSPEEVANVIASLTEALEEIDPNIFEGAETESADEDEEEYEDEDEDDLDFDDDEYDEDDEDDDEEEEEDEDDDDDD